MADFSVSPLIKNTAVSVIPHSDKATEFVDELPQQFKRFIADTLVSVGRVEFIASVLYANHYRIKQCKFRGYPGDRHPT